MQTAVHIRHAAKTYPNGFTALEDVSFQVEKGEFFGLLGSNGAGKTTLISAMAGLSRLTSGSISVMGHDVAADSYAARMSLGVVPQELVFDPFFTVLEALKFQSGYFGIKNNGDWIEEIIRNLGLADKAHTNTRNLSGGMKRRVMVAQALAHRPPVIVLDEPTAGVDVELRQSLWTFISDLNREGHTVILTTHYLEEAQSLCDRIAMLKQGRLVALDKTENLLQNEQGVRAEILLGAGTLPDNLRQWLVSEGNGQAVFKLDNYDQLAFVLQTLNYAGVEVKHLSLPETDLEDVFVKMMK